MVTPGHAGYPDAARSSALVCPCTAGSGSMAPSRSDPAWPTISNAHCIADLRSVPVLVRASTFFSVAAAFALASSHFFSRLASNAGAPSLYLSFRYASRKLRSLEKPTRAPKRSSSKPPSIEERSWASIEASVRATASRNTALSPTALRSLGRATKKGCTPSGKYPLALKYRSTSDRSSNSLRRLSNFVATSVVRERLGSTSWITGSHSELHHSIELCCRKRMPRCGGAMSSFTILLISSGASPPSCDRKMNPGVSISTMLLHAA
mmetsp:Transcript_18987/g.61903  ORF Transcript_18987/g.61903 Transcript_18987/m.61903 type:complete len:265 (+) Transcript_18987:682-1476(+)